MYCYSWFGLTIHSELELPELPPGTGVPDVFVRFGDVPRIGGSAATDDEFAFSETHVGRFRAMRGREIIIDPIADANLPMLRAMLLGRVTAYLLRQRGWLPLHASAAAVDGEGIVFMGESGAGKSTMAAAFHARGHSVAADEVCGVRVGAEGPELLVAGSRVRLLESSLRVLDAYSYPARSDGDARSDGAKETLDLNRSTLPAVIPLRLICELAFGEPLAMKRLRASAAAQLLSFHSFISIRGMDPEVTATHLRHCLAVAADVSVQSLVRPRSLDAVAGVVEFIEKRCFRSV